MEAFYKYEMTGRVVLTSNISPMNDVAGEGAFLVNPSKLESINKGFTRLISDDVLREIILVKAQKNIVKYLPAKVIGQYCQIYDVLKKKFNKEWIFMYSQLFQ